MPVFFLCFSGVILPHLFPSYKYRRYNATLIILVRARGTCARVSAYARAREVFRPLHQAKTYAPHTLFKTAKRPAFLPDVLPRGEIMKTDKRLLVKVQHGRFCVYCQQIIKVKLRTAAHLANLFREVALRAFVHESLYLLI